MMEEQESFTVFSVEDFWDLYNYNQSLIDNNIKLLNDKIRALSYWIEELQIKLTEKNIKK